MGEEAFGATGLRKKFGTFYDNSNAALALQRAA